MKLYTESQIRDALDNEDFTYIADVVIAQMKPIDKTKVYSEIEAAIIRWTLDRTKTAGFLTREIMLIIK